MKHFSLSQLLNHCNCCQLPNTPLILLTTRPIVRYLARRIESQPYCSSPGTLFLQVDCWVMSRALASNQGPQQKIGATTVYLDVVYITSPWGVFPSSIARRLRGCQYRTIRIQKGLGDMFLTPTYFWQRQYSSGGDIDHGKSAQGGVIV